MKKSKITKLLSLFLALLVIIGTIPPVTVSAANNMQSNPTGGSNTGGTVPNYVSSETMWKVHIYIGKKDTTNRETKLTGGNWYKVGKKDILLCNESITWANYLFCDDNKVEYLNANTDYTKVDHTFKTSSSFICLEDDGAPDAPLSGNNSTASTVKKYFGNAGQLNTFLKAIATYEGYSGNASGVKKMLNEVVYNPKNKAKISNPDYTIDGKTHRLSSFEGKKDGNGKTITCYPNDKLSQSFEYLVVYEPIVITRWPGGYGINHSGKTYSRAGFTATDFIVLQSDGLTITNLGYMYYYTGSSAFLEDSWVGYKKSTADEYYKGMSKDVVYKKGGWGMRNAENKDPQTKLIDYAADVSVSPSTVKTGGEVTATFKVTNSLGDKASIPTKVYARIHKSGSDYYWYDLSKLTKLTKTNYTAVGTWNEVKSKLADTSYSVNKGKTKTITKTVTIENTITEGTTIQFASFVNLAGYTKEYNPGIRTYSSDYGTTFGNNYDLKQVKVGSTTEISPQITVQLKDNTGGLESVEGKRFGVWAWYSYINGTKTNYEVATATSNGFLGVITTDASGKGTLDLTDTNVSGSNRTATTKGRVPSGTKDNVSWAYALTGNGNLFANTTKGNVFSYFNPNNSNNVTAYNADGSIKSYTAKLNRTQVSGSYPTQHIFTHYYDVTSGNGKNDLSIYNTLPKQYGNIFSKEKGNLGENHYAILSYVIRPIEETDNDAVYYTYNKSGTWYNVDAYTTNKNGNGFQKYQSGMGNIYYTVSGDYVSDTASDRIVADTDNTATLTMYKTNPSKLSSADAKKQVVYRDFANGYFSTSEQDFNKTYEFVLEAETGNVEVQLKKGSGFALSNSSLEGKHFVLIDCDGVPHYSSGTSLKTSGGEAYGTVTFTDIRKGDYTIRPFVYGDVNFNGKINSGDIDDIKDFIADGLTKDDVALATFEAMDCNNDGKVNSADVDRLTSIVEDKAKFGSLQGTYSINSIYKDEHYFEPQDTSSNYTVYTYKGNSAYNIKETPIKLAKRSGELVAGETSVEVFEICKKINKKINPTLTVRVDIAKDDSGRLLEYKKSDGKTATYSPEKISFEVYAVSFKVGAQKANNLGASPQYYKLGTINTTPVPTSNGEEYIATLDLSKASDSIFTNSPVMNKDLLAKYKSLEEMYAAFFANDPDVQTKDSDGNVLSNKMYLAVRPITALPKDIKDTPLWYEYKGNTVNKYDIKLNDLDIGYNYSLYNNLTGTLTQTSTNGQTKTYNDLIIVEYETGDYNKSVDVRIDGKFYYDYTVKLLRGNRMSDRDSKEVTFKLERTDGAGYYSSSSSIRVGDEFAFKNIEKGKYKLYSTYADAPYYLEEEFPVNNIVINKDKTDEFTLNVNWTFNLNVKKDNKAWCNSSAIANLPIVFNDNGSVHKTNSNGSLAVNTTKPITSMAVTSGLPDCHTIIGFDGATAKAFKDAFNGPSPYTVTDDVTLTTTHKGEISFIYTSEKAGTLIYKRDLYFYGINPDGTEVVIGTIKGGTSLTDKSELSGTFDNGFTWKIRRKASDTENADGYSSLTGTISNININNTTKYVAYRLEIKENNGYRQHFIEGPTDEIITVSELRKPTNHKAGNEEIHALGPYKYVYIDSATMFVRLSAHPALKDALDIEEVANGVTFDLDYFGASYENIETVTGQSSYTFTGLRNTSGIDFVTNFYRIILQTLNTEKYYLYTSTVTGADRFRETDDTIKGYRIKTDKNDMIDVNFVIGAYGTLVVNLEETKGAWASIANIRPQVALVRSDGYEIVRRNVTSTATFTKLPLEGYTYTLKVQSPVDCHEWVYPKTITQADFLAQKDNDFTVNTKIQLRPICTGTLTQNIFIQDPENPRNRVPINEYLPYEQYSDLVFEIYGVDTKTVFYKAPLAEGTNKNQVTGIDISKTANDIDIGYTAPGGNSYITLVEGYNGATNVSSFRNHTVEDGLRHHVLINYTYKLKYDGKITVNLTASERLQPKDGEGYIVTLIDTENNVVVEKKTEYKSGNTSSVVFYNLPDSNYTVEIEEAKGENRIITPDLVQENIKVNQTVNYELHPTGKIIANISYDNKTWNKQLEGLSIGLVSNIEGDMPQYEVTDSNGQVVFNNIRIEDDVTYTLSGVDLDCVCNVHKNEFGVVNATEFTADNNFTVTKTQEITTPCIGLYEINFENLKPAYETYWKNAKVSIYKGNGSNVTIPDENGNKYREITGDKLIIPFDISGSAPNEFSISISGSSGGGLYSFVLVDGDNLISATKIRGCHDDPVPDDNGHLVDNYTHTVSATYRLSIKDAKVTIELEELPSVWLEDYTTQILVFDQKIDSFDNGYFANENEISPIYKKEITRDDIRNYLKLVTEKADDGASTTVAEKTNAKTMFEWTIANIDISEEAEIQEYFIYVINSSEEHLENADVCEGCYHEWSSIGSLTVDELRDLRGNTTVSSRLSSKCRNELNIKFTDNEYTDKTETFTVEVYAYDYEGNLVRNPEAYLNTEKQEENTVKAGQFYYHKTNGTYHITHPDYEDAYEPNRFLPQKNFFTQGITETVDTDIGTYIVGGAVFSSEIDDEPKYDYYYSYTVDVNSNETVNLKSQIPQLNYLTGVEKKLSYSWKYTTVNKSQIVSNPTLGGLIPGSILIYAYRYPEVTSVTTEEVPVTYKYVIKSSSGDVYYYDDGILTNKKEVDTDFSDFVNVSHSTENEIHSITREFQRGTPKEFKVEIKKIDDKSYWYTSEIEEKRPVLNLNDVGAFNQSPNLNDNGSAITHTDIRQPHNYQNIAEFTNLDITGSAPDNYYFAPVVKLEGIEPEHENCFKFTEIEPVSTEELREEGIVQREYTLYSDCYGVITGRVSVPSYMNPLEVKIAVEGKESKYYTYLDENGNYELRLPIDGTSDLNYTEGLTIYYQEEKLDKFYSNSENYYYNFIFEDGSDYTYDKYGNGYNAFECGLEWLRRQEHICDGGEYNDAHKIVCNALISNDSKEIELSVTHLIDEEFVDTAKFYPMLAVDILDKATGYVYFSSRKICESDDSCLQYQSLSFDETFSQTVPRGVDLIVKVYHLNYDFDSERCGTYNDCRCKLGEIYNGYGEPAFDIKEGTTLEVTTDVDETVDVIEIDFTTRANWYVCTDIFFDAEDEAVVNIVNDYLKNGNYSYNESWEEYDENSDSYYEKTAERNCMVSDDIVDKQNEFVTISTLANAQKKTSYEFDSISFDELEQRVEALNESLPADADYYYKLSYSESVYYFNTDYDLSAMDVPFPVIYSDFYYAKDYTVFYTISIDKVTPSQTGNLTIIIDGDNYLSEKDNVEFDFALFVPYSYANEYHVLSAVENNSITLADIPIGEYSIEHNDNYIYEATAHWSYLTSRTKSEDGIISHSIEVKPGETTIIRIHITADWHVSTKFTDLDGGSTAGIQYTYYPNIGANINGKITELTEGARIYDLINYPTKASSLNSIRIVDPQNRTWTPFEPVTTEEFLNAYESNYVVRREFETYTETFGDLTVTLQAGDRVHPDDTANFDIEITAPNGFKQVLSMVEFGDSETFNGVLAGNYTAKIINLENSSPYVEETENATVIVTENSNSEIIVVANANWTAIIDYDKTEEAWIKDASLSGIDFYFNTDKTMDAVTGENGLAAVSTTKALTSITSVESIECHFALDDNFKEITEADFENAWKDGYVVTRKMFIDTTCTGKMSIKVMNANKDLGISKNIFFTLYGIDANGNKTVIQENIKGTTEDNRTANYVIENIDISGNTNYVSYQIVPNVTTYEFNGTQCYLILNHLPELGNPFTVADLRLSHTHGSNACGLHTATQEDKAGNKIEDEIIYVVDEAGKVKVNIEISDYLDGFVDINTVKNASTFTVGAFKHESVDFGKTLQLEENTHKVSLDISSLTTSNYFIEDVKIVTETKNSSTINGDKTVDVDVVKNGSTEITYTIGAKGKINLTLKKGSDALFDPPANTQIEVKLNGVETDYSPVTIEKLGSSSSIPNIDLSKEGTYSFKVITEATTPNYWEEIADVTVTQMKNASNNKFTANRDVVYSSLYYDYSIVINPPTINVETEKDFTFTVTVTDKRGNGSTTEPVLELYWDNEKIGNPISVKFNKTTGIATYTFTTTAPATKGTYTITGYVNREGKYYEVDKSDNIATAQVNVSSGESDLYLNYVPLNTELRAGEETVVSFIAHNTGTIDVLKEHNVSLTATLDYEENFSGEIKTISIGDNKDEIETIVIPGTEKGGENLIYVRFTVPQNASSVKSINATLNYNPDSNWKEENYANNVAEIPTYGLFRETNSSNPGFTEKALSAPNGYVSEIDTPNLTGYNQYSGVEVNGFTVVKRIGNKAQWSIWEEQSDKELIAKTYNAELISKSIVKVDNRCLTSKKVDSTISMKSGYAVTLAVIPNVITTGSGQHSSGFAVTDCQFATAYFPELSYSNVYGNYSELVKIDTADEFKTSQFTTMNKSNVGTETHDFPVLNETVRWELPLNEKSNFAAFMQDENPTIATQMTRKHFTPLWWKDGAKYEIKTEVSRAWTPCGIIANGDIAKARTTTGSSSSPVDLIINGSVYDDYYTVR